MGLALVFVTVLWVTSGDCDLDPAPSSWSSGMGATSHNQEKPGEISLCFHHCASSSVVTAGHFAWHSGSKKKSMQMNTTSSKLCLFCKMQVTWKIAEFIFCSLSWLLGFSSCYLYAIFFRLSKLSSIWQFTPEFGVKGNISYSVFILPGAEAPGSLWVLQP